MRLSLRRFLVLIAALGIVLGVLTRTIYNQQWNKTLVKWELELEQKEKDLERRESAIRLKE